MNPTKIEWVCNPDGTQGYTCNSKTGCLNHTPDGLCLGGLFPCYAFRLAHGRLRDRYSLSPSAGWKINYDPGKLGYSEACIDPFYPKWWPRRLEQIRRHKKPVGIFLDDMSDWMGDYWPDQWTEQELQVMRDCPQHRFYTLTKQPQNLTNFSPFPDNSWVGVTATNVLSFTNAAICLGDIKAKIKYISIEPLLAWGDYPADREAIEQWAKGLKLYGINWLIIGACTGTEEEMEKLQNHHQSLSVMSFGGRWTAQPPIEWVQEILEAADRAGIPVFLKDNLKPLLKPLPGNLRQEIPK